MPELEMKTDPKQACISCHFLVGQDTSEYGGSSTLSGIARRYFRAGDASQHPEILDATDYIFKMGCVRGVWQEWATFNNDERREHLEDFRKMRLETFRKVLEVERQDTCYYFRGQTGMNMDTAKDLWRRQEDNRKEQLAREREDRFTLSQNKLAQANLNWARIITIATILAAIATAVQVFLQFTRSVP